MVKFNKKLPNQNRIKIKSSNYNKRFYKFRTKMIIAVIILFSYLQINHRIQLDKLQNRSIIIINLIMMNSFKIIVRIKIISLYRIIKKIKNNNLLSNNQKINYNLLKIKTITNNKLFKQKI